MNKRFLMKVLPFFFQNKLSLLLHANQFLNTDEEYCKNTVMENKYS